MRFLKHLIFGLALILSGPALAIGQQVIGVGAVANDGTGDTVRAAMQKVNANFTELYARGKVFNATDYGAKFDGVKLTDCTTSSSTLTITCTSGAFTSADVGKVFAVTSAALETIQSAGAYLARGTITAVGSGTSITVSAQPTSTVSGTAILYYGTDDSAAIQAALDAANPNDTLGTGTWKNTTQAVVSLPAGMAMTITPINLRTKVTLKGQGRAATIIKWASTTNLNTSGFHGILQAEQANGSTRIYQDVQLRDFTVDGRAATVGTYGYQAKTFIGLYMMRTVVKDMAFLGSPATAVGLDYMWGGLFSGNYIENPGRLFASAGGGGSGFDFQTNYNWAPVQREAEAVIITENIVLNPAVSCVRNTNNVNTLANSRTIITNNYCITNKTTGKGFEDNGDTGAIISGNYAINSATQANGGTAVDQEQWCAFCSYGGNFGQISNNSAMGGWFYGVRLYRFKYNSSTLHPNDYLVSGNNIQGSAAQGIRVEVDNTYTIQDLSILGNRIASTGAAGLAITGTATGTAKRILIANNTFRDVGATTATDTEKSAILVESTAEALRVIGNTADDTGGATLKYGLTVNTVGVTASFIEGNDFSDVTTDQLNLASGGTFAGEMRGNKGYRPAITTPTIPASPGTYTAGITPEVLNVSGTLTTITIGGTTVASAAPATIMLNPNEAAVFTYGGAAPTVAVQKMQ